MKKLLLLSVLLFSTLAFSQDKNENEILEVVDRAAEFPSGMSAFRNEFAKNVKVNRIKGKGIFQTEVKFIVERDGNISEIKARGENESFNIEAIKAIKKIKTKWSPGIYKSTPVRMYFRFPATINI